MTNKDIDEDAIKKQIRKLEGKGAVTMSILQRREEIGIQKGRQEGRQEEIREIAKNLLREGGEIDLVVKATGISKIEVEKLKKEIEN